MFAIFAKPLPATETKGARVKAWAAHRPKEGVVIGLGNMETREAATEAARRVAAMLDAKGKWHRGGTAEGWVFVLADVDGEPAFDSDPAF